jgi:hypothetical protein
LVKIVDVLLLLLLPLSRGVRHELGGVCVRGFVRPNVRAERTPEACCVSPTCDDVQLRARRAYAACRRRSARARG